MAALSLSPEAAYEALAVFARRCGRGPLELAMHAAVPDGFRLDLLPLLRRNFLPRLSTDASADADLLLAPFCEHLGNNYFQLDPETRRLLLDQLTVAYGPEARPRLPRIAAFLLAYVERAERNVRSSEDRVLQAYLEIQRWNALGFLDPPAAARALAEAIQVTAARAGAARVRLGTVAAVLNLPLGPYYRRFIEYTLGVDAISRGDQQQARDWLAPFEEETPQIEGVRLKTVQELMPSAPEHARTSKAEPDRPQLTTVYISSTYEDLKEHRQAVFDALRPSGYQVIGMEDYVARDDRPVAACLANVERADLYVGLFAFRYGYIPPAEQGNPDGLSITELEWRRANASPTTHCLVFLLDEEAPWQPRYVDIGDQGARIRVLREELSRENTVSFFHSPRELATMVVSAVSQLLQTTSGTSGSQPVASIGLEALRAAVERMAKPHRRFEGGVEWALTEQGVSIDHRAPEISGEMPTPADRIWKDYGDQVIQWSTYYGVPAELILATICTESGGRAEARREEPGYVSEEQTPDRVSLGLMQVMLQTARAVLQRSDIDAKWLLDPGNAIQAGTAFIASQFSLTGFDPPLVACAYNTGGIHPDSSPENRWRIRQVPIGTGKHADRFVSHVNDSFGLFAELEASGWSGDVSPVSLRHLLRDITRPASSEPETNGIDVFVSYSGEDAERANRLVRALRDQRWAVWIDRERVATAKAWEREAKEALDHARCIVVLITPHSLASRWVAEEIAHARDRGILIPILLTPTNDLQQLPQVDPAQAIDLSGWTGDPEHPELIKLFSAVQRIAGRPLGPSTDETERLLRELEDPEKPHQRRAEIGDRLAELGDPRPGIGVGPDGTPDIDWVAIPAGEVELEGTVGKADVAPFHMSRYLITNAQFQAFAEAADGYANADWWKDMPPGANNGPEKPRWGESNRPRETVSWFEAVAYCRWLSGRLDFEVRLPTEYEWQQAATGGDPSHAYPWGREWDDRHCNTSESGLQRTTAVGLYPAGANAQGVLDLSGNLWEWCLNTYETPTETSPDAAESRVLRGGSWYDNQGYARADYRLFNPPRLRGDYSGFRVVCGSPIR